MLIVEEFLLLALDDRTGRPLIGAESLEPALGGALLAELALRERISIAPASAGWRTKGRVSVTVLTPTDDPELDRVLQTIDEHEGVKIGALISSMSGKRITKHLQERLLDRLASAGVLSEEHGKVLGLFPRTSWPARDAAAEDEIRQRLQSALVAGLTPTEQTATLIALLNATGLLTKVVSSEDKKALRTRAKELSAGDWAGEAVRAAIEEVAAVTAAAAAGGAVAAGAS